MARALQLAGIALGRPEWAATAETAIQGTLALSEDQHGVVDAGLCHGWAGLLHITRQIAADAQDASLGQAVASMAQRVVDQFDRRAPFGFRVSEPNNANRLDLAGLLQGSAGIALALHSYSTGELPASGWDAALLIS